MPAVLVMSAAPPAEPVRAAPTPGTDASPPTPAADASPPTLSDDVSPPTPAIDVSPPTPVHVAFEARPAAERSQPVIRTLAAAEPPARQATAQAAVFEPLAFDRLPAGRAPAQVPPAADELTEPQPQELQVKPEPPKPTGVQPTETTDAHPAEWLAQASPTAKPAAEARAALPAEAPVPTYRTRAPAAASLAYRLSRGAIVGIGSIEWRPMPGGAYDLQLEGSVPLLGTLITQVSRGRIDGTGLAPERHTDRRLRRGEQAANFDRAAGRISFSGQAPDLPMSPGVQDRVSVMIQLPAIVNAWGRLPPVGEHVLIRVIGARGDAHVWSLRFEGPQAVDTPGSRVNALRFLREPEGPNDTRAEFWLDPARQHLPVKVVLTDGKGDALELLRTP